MNASMTKKSQQITASIQSDQNFIVRSKRERRNLANWARDHELQEQISALQEDTLELIKPDVYREMMEGTIPNLISVCEELYFSFAKVKNSFNALQFIPVLNKRNGIDPLSTERFLSNPKTNHILVQNSLIKVVLIHWRPGHYSSIHGHAAGGCVFKVLSGSLEEKRFSPDAKHIHLTTTTAHQGSLAYIDDTLAHHAVGNPFDIPAISLHAYTPGIH